MMTKHTLAAVLVIGLLAVLIPVLAAYADEYVARASDPSSSATEWTQVFPVSSPSPRAPVIRRDL
jgi:hypothetical protein